MTAKGGARTHQHFLSRMAGKPFGPAAELIRSFMAASNSSSEKIILVMEDLPKGSLGNKS